MDMDKKTLETMPKVMLSKNMARGATKRGSGPSRDLKMS